MIEAVQRAKEEKARIQAEATKLAIECTAITKGRVAVELGLIGFANMMDCMRVGPSGDPVLDFSKLTREEAAALTEVTVDDYLDRTSRRGSGNAKRWRRSRRLRLNCFAG